MTLKTKLFLSCAVGVMLAGSGTRAQTTDQANRAGGLEEVVVTAEKRTEKLQDVPIAVSAFSGADLQDKAVSNIHDLGNLVPNVTLDQGSPFSGSNAVLSASIRGIGQDDFAFNLDPGVGVYIDGIYLGRTVGANQNLLDVERVEILKGPQGTLFGRNTIGGAISVVTRTPSDQFDATGSVTTGSYNRSDIAASADMPISDKLLSSFTISSEIRDGYQKRIPYPRATGTVVDPITSVREPGYGAASTSGGENQQTMRGKLLWKATPDVKVTVTADWTHEDTGATASTILKPVTSGPTAAFGAFYNLCIQGVAFVPTAALVCGPRTGSGTSLWQAGSSRLLYAAQDSQTGDIDTTYASGINFTKLDSFGGAVTVDWTLADNLSLKSISGYRRLNWASGQDQSGSPIPDFFTTAFSEGQHQFSQELQLIGNAIDSRLNYVLGLYYFNEGGFIHDYVTFGGGLLQIDGPNTLDTSSYAGFAHADYKLTDRIGMTLGGRYSLEHKEFTGGQQEVNDFFYKIAGCYPVTTACQQQLNLPNPANPQQLYPPGLNKQNFYIFNPTVGLQYHFDDDRMAYISYSKGFKSGGWTTRLTAPLAVPVAPSFGPEKAETYEVGYKSEWFDRHLIANLAGFYTFYDGIQLQFQQGTSPVTANAGNADIRGAELETRALLGDSLSLNTSAGYIDAYYTELAAGVQGITLGSKLPKTPKWKFTTGPSYDLTMDDSSDLRFAADVSYTSSLYNDTANTPLLKRPDVTTINASAAYISPNGKYQVTLGATNITNQRYLTTGEDQEAGGAIFGTYNAPSEWYLNLRVRL